jgi:hypothetical protein
MKTPHLASALAPALIAALAAAGAQDLKQNPAESPSAKLAPSRKNASAEELESLALALGIDFRRPLEDPTSRHASKEDFSAYQRAAFADWLNAQLAVADDSIGPPPADIREFLEQRQKMVMRVVRLLGREVPAWDFDARDKAGERPELFGSIRLGRLLVSAALVEERAGDHGLAGDLLEASWSLSRSFAGRADLSAQIIALAFEKLHAGALRKLSEPPFPWIGRLSGDEPRRAVIDAFETMPLSGSRAESALPDESRLVLSRAWQAMTDPLRKLSPCELAKLSDEDILLPGKEEVERWIQSGGDQNLRVLFDVSVPNSIASIRRADRLLVDREMTRKILKLRQDRAASREKRWPGKLVDDISRICPGAPYEYQSRGPVMSLRFRGTIDEPATGLSLPLFFEVRPPRVTPSPVPTRTPAITPAPSLSRNSERMAFRGLPRPA